MQGVGEKHLFCHLQCLLIQLVVRILHIQNCQSGYGSMTLMPPFRTKLCFLYAFEKNFNFWIIKLELKPNKLQVQKPEHPPPRIKLGKNC
jgi:hypothetical protein